LALLEVGASAGLCLLPDRYHLVVETRRATLARGMRQLNGRYTQAFNRRHGVGGHVFQGRYRAVMVESPAFLAAVCRDVLRQPVARGLAAEAAAWRWSSLRALAGRLPPGRRRRPRRRGGPPGGS